MTLDARPWEVTYNGVVSHRTGTFRARFTNGFGEVVVRQFNPRPGFSRVESDYPTITKENQL